MSATHIIDAVPSRPRKDGVGSLSFRLGLLAVAICWLLVFFPALSSAAKIWWISEYYTHGLVVLPAIIYACWIRREELLGETWQPAYGVAPLLLATLLLYLLGTIGRVSLFQHVAAFASLPLIAWLCLGNALFLRSYNIMLLPLLAIPIGAELGPLLQQLTAYMSAVLLSLTDITFIRRGLFFDVPNGTFLVAEECSGVRFLISSIAFAVFYVELFYRSLWRKLAFLLFACVVPLVANAFRVTGTIMIGDRYGMELASGVDHVVYGWFFFSFVLLAMIFAGRFFQEIPSASPEIPDGGSQLGLPVIKAFYTVAAGLLLFFLVARFYSLESDSGTGKLLDAEILPAFTQHSVRRAEAGPTAAHFHNASDHLALQSAGFDLDVWWYENDSADAELVSSQNTLYDPDIWSVSSSALETILVGGESVSVSVHRLVSSRGEERVVLPGYIVEGRFYSTGYEAKLAQVLSRLAGRSGSGAAVIVSAKDASDEPLSDVFVRYAESAIERLTEKLANLSK